MFGKLIQRIRMTGLWPTIKYLIFTVLFERLDIHVSVIFEQTLNHIESHKKDGYHCDVIQSLDDLTTPVRDALVEYGGHEMIADFAKSFSQGQQVALGFSDGRFGCVCWFQRQRHGLFDDQPVHLIWRSFTLPEMRGRKLFPLTMKCACSYIRRNPDGDFPIVAESSLFNTSSIRGIESAGFGRISKKIEIGRWGRFF